MSTFAVKIEKIVKVEKHPNADRLDLIQINDWQCVTGKGNFKEGDLCLYLPIDSVLPVHVETKLFSPDSKVKLHNSRIKTIKLRGAISQGMAVKPEELGITYYKEGHDFTSRLCITQYQPVVKGQQLTKGKSTKKASNPHFRKYTGIENAKNYPNVFTAEDEVVVTEKLHGSNFRGGWVPFYSYSFWQKIKAMFGLTPKYEYVYGSHNVQLQSKWVYSGYYKYNIYSAMAEKYDLKSLPDGYVVYGEIIGPSVQKGYHYGMFGDEIDLVVFDVMYNGVYLDYKEAKDFCASYFLQYVPILYVGPFNKEKILELRNGDSVYSPSQKIREGVVVKPTKESVCYNGRKILKYVSEAYLLGVDDSEGFAH